MFDYVYYLKTAFYENNLVATAYRYAACILLPLYNALPGSKWKGALWKINQVTGIQCLLSCRLTAEDDGSAHFFPPFSVVSVHPMRVCVTVILLKDQSMDQTGKCWSIVETAIKTFQMIT